MAVVFIPGFAQRGDAWGPVAATVAQRYSSVVCLDFRSWTFEERLSEIASRISDGDVAVGYSMGGRLSLAATVRRPRRFAALVVVGTSAGIQDQAERARRRAADERLATWMEDSPIEAVVARWERQPVFASQPPELVAAQRPGRLSHDPALLAQLLRSAGQGVFEPLWERLGSIDVPLLAVAGERDTAYVDAAFRMAELVPQGRARVVPGAGHAPQLERPEEFTRLLLDFLDEHLGQR